MRTIKNTIRKASDFATCTAIAAKCKCDAAMNDFRSFNRRALSGNAGEGYIDTAVKILIAVVIGALLLAGLYALFNDTVMPTLKSKIEGMFNYAG